MNPDRDTQPTFLDLIEQLTARHPKTVGGITQTVDGLLQQLRGAIFLGLETGGAGAAFGSRLPLDASSSDLLEEIDRQAAQALASVQHAPTPYGTTEAYVRLWAGQTTEGKSVTVTARRSVSNPYQVADAAIAAGQRIPPTVETVPQTLTAYQLAQSWIDRIEDLFDPPSTREIRAKCPACDVRYVHKVKDGQHVRSSALNFVRDREGRTTAAKCSACLVSWGPPQFEWLARNVGAKPLPEMSVDEEKMGV